MSQQDDDDSNTFTKLAILAQLDNCCNCFDETFSPVERNIEALITF